MLLKDYACISVDDNDKHNLIGMPKVQGLRVTETETAVTVLWLHGTWE